MFLCSPDRLGGCSHKVLVSWSMLMYQLISQMVVLLVDTRLDSYWLISMAIWEKDGAKARDAEHGQQSSSFNN